MRVRELSRAEQVAFVTATVAALVAKVPRSRASEFAEAVTCDPATVVRWIDGDNLPSFFMAQRIHEKLKGWKP